MPQPLQIIGLLRKQRTGETKDGITNQTVIYQNPNTGERFYTNEDPDTGNLPVSDNTYSHPTIRKITPAPYAGTPHPTAIVIRKDILTIEHPTVNELFKDVKEKWFELGESYFHPIASNEYIPFLQSYALTIRPDLITRLINREQTGTRALLRLYKAFGIDELEETLMDLFYHKVFGSPKEYNLTRLVLQTTWGMDENTAWRQIHNVIR